MWHLLKAELAYGRVVLAVSWAVALAVGLLVIVLDGGLLDDAVTVLPGIFVVWASMVAAFIAGHGQTEERRMRLQLAHRSPLEVALAMVALPAAMTAVGAVAGGLVAAAGVGFREDVGILGLTGFALFVTQLGPLSGEMAAAWRQGRRGAWLAGNALMVLVLAVVIASGGPRLGDPPQPLPLLVVAGAAMLLAAVTIALFVRRTDFTR